MIQGKWCYKDFLLMEDYNQKVFTLEWSIKAIMFAHDDCYTDYNPPIPMDWETLFFSRRN